jgi:fatty acid desaturase
MAGNSWTALAVAPLVHVICAQLGFIGHDAGHNQVFGTRQRNRVLGRAVGNTLIGLSFGWWVPKHNAHHAHPNELGRDPDIGEGAALAWPGVPGNGPGPGFIVAGALAGAAVLPSHAAAKRRYARAGDQAAAAAAGPCFGGLNYQIEHHLFPSMPRPNLRQAQGLVRDFCAAADLGYSEENFTESFRQIIHHLSDAGAAASRRPGGAVSADAVDRAAGQRP